MSKFGSSRKRVILVDVAKASGFSLSTVSIVLAEAPLSRYVAATTKRKIVETAKKLGYRPNVYARALRSQRSHTIGVLVIDMADPFCTLVLQGIERKLLTTPYLPILMDAQNQPEQMKRYLEMMVERRVEGLITVANWLLFDIDLIKDMDSQGIPAVVVGQDLDSATVNSVLVDNEAGGYAALEHLYELGHREIAFVRGPRAVFDSRIRWKGIRRFARDAGLLLDPKLVRELPNTTGSNSGFHGGLHLTEDLIRSGVRFTAILAFDDLTAYGAIRALSAAGRHVPQECSVIGFDDIPAAAFSTPGLTTIQQPMHEMGEFAAGYILRHLEDGTPYSGPHRVPPTLRVRDSTAQHGR